MILDYFGHKNECSGISRYTYVHVRISLFSYRKPRRAQKHYFLKKKTHFFSKVNQFGIKKAENETDLFLSARSFLSEIEENGFEQSLNLLFR
jgi:hypothetical protein